MSSLTYAVQSEEVLKSGQVLEPGNTIVFVTRPAGRHEVGVVLDVGRLTCLVQWGSKEVRIFRCFVLRTAAQ